MGHVLKAFLTVVWLLLFVPSQGMPLERMTFREMGQVTAQGGISLALDDVMVYTHADFLTFKDVETLDFQGNPLSDQGYLTGGFESFFRSSMCFDLDLGSYDPQGMLVFSENSGSVAGIKLTRNEGSSTLTLAYDDIRVWNHSLGEESHLGDFSIVRSTVLDFDMTLFPPVAGGSGVRLLGGIKVETDAIGFSTNSIDNDLAVSGVMMGGSISGEELPNDNLGTAPIDTGSWAFDDTLFRIGIPSHEGDPPGSAEHENTTLPFAVDISSGSRALEDGGFCTVPYLAIQAPMEGSFRIKGVASNGFDFGPIAIDGIRLYKNQVEFPGRGIGQ